jgi:hypothetical protein
MSAIAAIAAATALYGGISANQASQKQKGALGAQVNTQNQNYAALSPFRTTSTNLLNQAESPTMLANEYADSANPYAQGGSGQFTPITTQSGLYAPQVANAVNQLTSAPTPTQLAQSQFQQLLDQEAPQEAEQMEQVGQNAAKFGTLGYMNELNQLQGLNQSDLALQTQQQGVNTALGAQAVGFNQAQQNQAYNQAMGTASLGFNPSQVPNYAPIVSYYGNQAAANTAGMNSAAGALGSYLGNQNTNNYAPGYNPNPQYVAPSTTMSYDPYAFGVGYSGPTG